MKIVTNNQPRPLLSIDELTAVEREDFDWMDDDAAADCAQFFRYKCEVYTLQEMVKTSIEGWDGVSGTSFFSSVLVKLQDDTDSVIVGNCYS